MSIASIRWIIGCALLVALGAYLLSRYSVYAERDRAITICMQGHGSARAACERRIDANH